MRLTLEELRQGVLALASHTGWSLVDILALPTREFLFWIDGLPRDG
ncbi:hypothetical protein [Xylella fastidiosa]|nr:hypothetical protein [Xylella fastidiosa]MDD0912031.1 hypothetical protein [Xylella fastidiosa subsp. multiplex]MDD0931910.1 hypothetical protein [Xylella fastidiosa subsp. multiplex]